MGAGTCPYCDQPGVVTTTRPLGRVTVRYQKCQHCKRRFATTERLDAQRTKRINAKHSAKA